MELTPRQQEAVDLIRTAKVGVLVGYAGTGKTTCVRAGVAAIGSEEYVHLAAPTGKAAKRLSQVSGKRAMTIHKLFDATVDDGFQARNYPKAGVFIFDEASMIDLSLAYEISRCISSRSRVIFVGDAGQLPSIGPGAVLRDLVASGAVPVVELDEVHRSAAESWVGRESQKIRQGFVPDLTPTPDFTPILDKRAGSVLGEITSLVLEAKTRGEHVPILTPRNGAPTARGAPPILGRYALNLHIQKERVKREKLEDHFKRPGSKQCSQQLYYGDPVVQIVNDPDRGVVNGDLGTVVAIGKIPQIKKPTEGVCVRYEDELGEPFEVWYDLHASYALFLAYAMTTHRSQGSEWPHVISVCDNSSQFLLSRELLYTSITRAKQHLTLVGESSAIEKACTRSATDRETRLQQELHA